MSFENTQEALLWIKEQAIDKQFYRLNDENFYRFKDENGFNFFDDTGKILSNKRYEGCANGFTSNGIGWVKVNNHFAWVDKYGYEYPFDENLSDLLVLKIKILQTFYLKFGTSKLQAFIFKNFVI